MKPLTPIKETLQMVVAHLFLFITIFIKKKIKLDYYEEHKLYISLNCLESFNIRHYVT